MTTTDGYPGPGDRLAVHNANNEAADRLAAAWQEKPFNIGPGGVQALGEQLAAARPEIRRMPDGSKLQIDNGTHDGVSRPLAGVDDGSAFSPDGVPDVSYLHGLVIIGDRLLAISSRETGGKGVLAVMDTRFGGANPEYKQYPTGDALQSAAYTVPEQDRGEIDPNNTTTVSAAGCVVEYRDGQLFVAVDGEACPEGFSLITASAGLEGSENKGVSEAYKELVARVQNSGSAWKAPSPKIVK